MSAEAKLVHLLREVARDLNRFAQESLDGSWSTQLVEPLRAVAAKIHRALDALPADGSSSEFVCEVGTVNTKTRQTEWREVARYSREADAREFLRRNAHCECRYWTWVQRITGKEAAAVS